MGAGAGAVATLAVLVAAVFDTRDTFSLFSQTGRPESHGFVVVRADTGRRGGGDLLGNGGDGQTEAVTAIYGCSWGLSASWA